MDMVAWRKGSSVKLPFQVVEQLADLKSERSLIFVIRGLVSRTNTKVKKRMLTTMRSYLLSIFFFISGLLSSTISTKDATVGNIGSGL